MTAYKRFIGVVLLVGVLGCTRSPPGGGPDRASGFTIAGPPTMPLIKQGETQNVALKVNRGKEFNDVVKLKANAPIGIEVVFSDSEVKTSDKNDVNLKVAVGNSAAPGEHLIQVTGTPDQGSTTTLDFKVRVLERRDTMKLILKAAGGAITVKRGETASVTIMLEPNHKYLADVKLKVEAPPGIRAEVTNASLKATEGSEAELRITAEENAPIGEHTIRVAGTADAASVNGADVKIRVIAP